MAGSVGRLVCAAVLMIPVAVLAQPSAGSSGQQQGQPSANQNEPQMQTDNNQQPANTKVLPPTNSSQSQPNPLPQLAR